jgi:hypothetical protein
MEDTMPEYNVKVDWAGAAKSGQFGILLSHLAGQGEEPIFSERWFAAANEAKREILAVALSAIASGKNCVASLDEVEPWSELVALYILNY